MHEADEHEARVEPEAGELGPAFGEHEADVERCAASMHEADEHEAGVERRAPSHGVPS
ncbi:hypothetical protein [Polyangium jinanense]|uniref:Uncharacterized protein n=1 Tax=Polyangium jinanense TaxID=2829994 RepID=A0A9X3XDL6_9BACT|nr:hypothetical protein [Polyangium jinanense]MDC3988392.1 hypothetical protein [Polyangium jinanense]